MLEAQSFGFCLMTFNELQLLRSDGLVVNMIRNWDA